MSDFAGMRDDEIRAEGYCRCGRKAWGNRVCLQCYEQENRPSWGAAYANRLVADMLKLNAKKESGHE